MSITKIYLCEILRYEKQSGKFFWAKPRPRITVGSKAGYVKKNKGYRYIEIDGITYAAHRLAWFYVYGVWPRNQIDHVNGKRDDNRIENLREATQGQNRANSKHNNKTGFKGVSFKAWLKEKPYQAQITVNKKVIYLGCYKTPQEANEAYKIAAIKLHGEFAKP